MMNGSCWPRRAYRFRSLVRELLGLRQRPTAVLCFDDWIACKVLREVKACTVRCPEDISIIGRGGGDLGKGRITSFRVNPGMMGRPAVRLLTERMRGRSPGAGKGSDGLDLDQGKHDGVRASLIRQARVSHGRNFPRLEPLAVPIASAHCAALMPYINRQVRHQPSAIRQHEAGLSREDRNPRVPLAGLGWNTWVTGSFLPFCWQATGIPLLRKTRPGNDDDLGQQVGIRPAANTRR